MNTIYMVGSHKIGENNCRIDDDGDIANVDDGGYDN